MSHFYGTVQGSRGEATRQGTKQSGIETHAAGWCGAIRAMVWHENGEDRFVVHQDTWHGGGIYEPLARGVLGKDSEARAVTPAMVELLGRVELALSKSHVLTLEELEAWGNELLEDVRRALKKD